MKDDEYEEFAEEEEEENVKVRSGRSKSKKSKAASLRPYLQEQTKAELVTLVIELADAHDAVRQSLADRRTLASGQTQKILQMIRREIQCLRRVSYGTNTTTETPRPTYGSPQGGAQRVGTQPDRPMRPLRLGPELLDAGQPRALEHDQRRRIRRSVRRLPRCSFSGPRYGFPVASGPE